MELISNNLNLVLAAISHTMVGGFCYYLGRRGWAGVETDLTNAKNELQKLKDEFNAHKATQAIQTPVVVSTPSTLTITPHA